MWGSKGLLLLSHELVLECKIPEMSTITHLPPRLIPSVGSNIIQQGITV